MKTLSLLESVRAQLKRMQQLLVSVESSEFPYDHSRTALSEIHQLLEEHSALLNGIIDTDDPAVVEFQCVAASTNIRTLLPIIGFILRSTNVRNAFEVWGPLWRLSTQVLGGNTKLLLSSEWEYSPSTLIGYHQLPGYVMIGFPATESSNPFLLPLAGHELGHSTWEHWSLRDEFTPQIQIAILKAIEGDWSAFARHFPGYTLQDIQIGSLGWRTWESAAALAARQAEESFCDFFGLRVFGESYLHSFAYVLGPFRQGPRSLYYPSRIDRAHALETAALQFGYEVPEDFLALFSGGREQPPESTKDQFLLSLAEIANRAITSHLIDRAESIAASAEIGVRQRKNVDACRTAFASMVPSEHSGGLANILNAGWDLLLTASPQEDPRLAQDKETYLAELILKSIEILEVEFRLQERDL